MNQPLWPIPGNAQSFEPMSEQDWLVATSAAALTPEAARVYSAASDLTGKSVAELRRLAEQVFISILHHVMRGEPVWTLARIVDGCRLDLEVGLRPRLAVLHGEGGAA